jgi:hypothetical protein
MILDIIDCDMFQEKIVSVIKQLFWRTSYIRIDETSLAQNRHRSTNLIIIDPLVSINLTDYF